MHVYEYFDYPTRIYEVEKQRVRAQAKAMKLAKEKESTEVTGLRRLGMKLISGCRRRSKWSFLCTRKDDWSDGCWSEDTLTAQGDWDDSTSPPEESNPWAVNDSPSPGESSTSLPENTSDQGKEARVKDMVATLPLGERTRLGDRSFFTTPAAYCRVSLEKQVHCLERAYRLAQTMLWNALGTYHPEVQQRTYPQGPLQVAFEWSLLSPLFGHSGDPSALNEMCGRDADTMHKAITDVSKLRNAFCHPTGERVEWLDTVIAYAQRLAVLTGDEGRASEVRALRDALQEEARISLEEIEADEEAMEWRSWHKETFQDFAFGSEEEKAEWPVAIAKVAERF
ncbi:Hypothetical predicted protein [Lecanosticta acicola]|uniref:Uncharacterized protein n=1 Tax=Lecanosticta acicola TaxID=111012 RepID=A0AAI8YU36_9PEZI|nr:Hypothetical predicted protein [Lecanosticta acicola]